MTYDTGSWPCGPEQEQCSLVAAIAFRSSWNSLNHRISRPSVTILYAYSWPSVLSPWKNFGKYCVSLTKSSLHWIQLVL